jgi:hypothetical protein
MLTSDQFEQVFLRAKATQGVYLKVDDAKAAVVFLAVQPAVLDVLRAAEASLRDGTHEGPCLNYDGQEVTDYTNWDACVIHMTTTRQREEDLALAISALADRIKNERDKAEDA